MGVSHIIVAALDIKGSHKDDPNCSARIAQHPGGHWYCVDCGKAITTIRVGSDTEGGALEFDADAPPFLVTANDVAITLTMTRDEWCETANALMSKAASVLRGDYHDPVEPGDPKRWAATLHTAYQRLSDALDKEGVVY